MPEHSIVSPEKLICAGLRLISHCLQLNGGGESLTQLPRERPDCVTSVAEIIKGEQGETFNKI